jgi:hypothetical protein
MVPLLRRRSGTPARTDTTSTRVPEALWKLYGSPRRPDPTRTRPQIDAETQERTGRHPDRTRSRPDSRALCKQEVTGSIPVGSIREVPANRQIWDP